MYWNINESCALTNLESGFHLQSKNNLAGYNLNIHMVGLRWDHVLKLSKITFVSLMTRTSPLFYYQGHTTLHRSRRHNPDDHHRKDLSANYKVITLTYYYWMQQHFPIQLTMFHQHRHVHRNGRWAPRCWKVALELFLRQLHHNLKRRLWNHKFDDWCQNSGLRNWNLRITNGNLEHDRSSPWTNLLNIQSWIFPRQYRGSISNIRQTTRHKLDHDSDSGKIFHDQCKVLYLASFGWKWHRPSLGWWWP